MIQLGKEAKDKITGFAGVVIGRVSYITGCDQYLIQPKVDKDKKHIGSKWIDEKRLVVTKKKQIVLSDNNDDGACDSAPTK